MNKIRDIMKPSLVRMGYFEQQKNNLTKMSLIQRYFAENYPFENLDVLLNNREPIDPDFLIDKLLIKKRGGLCYELNGALYLVLKAFGFDVTLGAATIATPYGWGIDETHTVVFFSQDRETYLLDSGLGTNLAMQPIPLDGKPVRSSVGAFRLRTEQTEKGSLVMEMLTEEGWRIQYGVFLKGGNFENDINRSKRVIHEYKNSPFNQGLLIASTLPDGTVSINDERMSRKWINEEGLVEREERTDFHNPSELLASIKPYTSASTIQKVKQYLEWKSD